jgi:hypothetical protein
MRDCDVAMTRRLVLGRAASGLALALTLGATTLGARPALADEGTGEGGNGADVEEAPIADLLILLRPLKTGNAQKMKTDARGEAVFGGLEPGRYELTLAGKDPISIDVPRGKTRIKVWATGKKHNYVGHVTLLR